MTSRESAPYVVISVDCHTGAPARVYREYLDARHRDEYDRQVTSTPGPINADIDAFEQYFRGNSRHLAPARRDAGDDSPTESWSAQFRAAYGRGDGMWESANRIRALDADGVVGEVLHPASQMTAGVPFGPTSGGAAGSEDPELVTAGVLAYNRWLADLCDEAPARHAGIAQTAPLSDIGHVVDAVVFAAAHDLRGGISLPDLAAGIGWHDPSCDPVWARCQEAGLPINVHGGLVRDRDGVRQRAEHAQPWLAATDDTPMARRPLWSFIAGGVLDRFPRLQLVFTEQLTAWVPDELDAIERALASLPRRHLELTAREYWTRNCFVGATFLSRAEVAARADVGVDRIMFGTDFPHPEGTYPFTRQALRHTFAAVPPEELRAMLGETAARVYGFDLTTLAAIAARFGPTVAEVATPLDERPHGSLSLQWR